ncbi:hypothetical protein VF14_25415 [Nostoc linckia z18]|uniref:Uncharacterized protein n=2 Tax=Nostoc linckia TaxID=92942 RepID=A0A9Q6EK67_NOSLI|nr:hypothetical protein VF02_32870 [Nostoc linckia z1]PHJ61369.1 hypothetical protein VF03_32280 [Nostoc linckia z2]PHJ73435.1 hypothetical protein VF05_02435 [Nostoc linckia z3]PHJ81362.1 hypothetical protein VF06_19775 [Nostoc linckia z4]PHJ92389.1 hypothetical protein VF07_02730 [Nostoc linckia z6]PHJ94340.1 hypothetical protein VF04_22765 [Nostoc linckia z7]PHJ98356.1 hypothetical protein VF09_35110 [Nostoc linckia z9]PHK01608.1 hypothetical protein VF08_21700 [Nostoc linckia z8]PHK1732
MPKFLEVGLGHQKSLPMLCHVRLIKLNKKMFVRSVRVACLRGGVHYKLFIMSDLADMILKYF